MDNSTNSIAKLVDKLSDEFMRKKNVVAVAVGEKWTNGKSTGKPALIVLVEKKESINKLAPQDIIPKAVGNVRTDVIGKVGKISASSFTRKERPAPAGISCGNPVITAGTIGCYFRDRSGDTVLLSNNHVIAWNSQVGQQVWQPGKYDRGNATCNIGRLKSFQKLVKPNGQIYNSNIRKVINYNLEDSAIASVNRTLITESIKTIGKLKGFNLNPTLSMKVQKVGRTTEKTYGRIIGLRASIYVGYDANTVLVFKDQIITNNMSQGGDSGSLLLDMTNKAVGLLFAGGNTITVYNRIYYPMALYGLKVI